MLLCIIYIRIKILSAFFHFFFFHFSKFLFSGKLKTSFGRLLAHISSVFSAKNQHMNSTPVSPKSYSTVQFHQRLDFKSKSQ